MRVLVVDDERDTRALLTALLSMYGALPSAAATAAEALEALEAGTYDALVLDLTLPDLSGAALLSKVRALARPYSAIPALAVTGHDDPKGQPGVPEAGFDGFLTKPVDQRGLASALVNILRAKASRGA